MRREPMVVDLSARPPRPLPAGTRLTLALPSPFDLRQTVLSHGWYELAPFRWDPTLLTLERAEVLPDGSRHLLRIQQAKGRRSRLRVSVPTGPLSREQRRQVSRRVRRMLGLDLHLDDFWALCRRHPRLRYVPRTGAGRFLSSGNLYEDVLKAICGTNITWKQAVAAVNRVAALGPLIGETGHRAFPTSDALRRMGPRRLSDVSRLGYRVPYLLEWAERVASGDPGWVAAESGKLTGEDLRRFFLSVRGVGKTTCHYLMMMRGFADQIPIDSSVYLYLKENRFAGRRPSERQIRRLYEPFGAWKAYAYWFEFLPWAKKHWSPQPGGTA